MSQVRVHNFFSASLDGFGIGEGQAWTPRLIGDQVRVWPPWRPPSGVGACTPAAGQACGATVMLSWSTT